MKNRTLLFSLALALLLLVADSVQAQSRRGSGRSSVRQFSRNSQQVRELFNEVAAKTSSSVCKIDSENKQVALGMVVSTDGLILTKYSEIESMKQLRCVFESGMSLEPRLLAVQAPYDLALLKIEAETTPMPWSDAATDAPVAGGRIVFVPDYKGRTISTGLTATSPRRFRTGQFVSQPRAFLGVECREVADEKGLNVRRVTRGSAASKAGIERGDQILQMDGAELMDVNQLVQGIRQRQPKDPIKLVIKRDDKLINLEAELGEVPTTTEQDKWGGGPFSERRFGFPSVIPHDSIIRPSHCGGPLLDIDGNLVGLNIARALRTTTYAVPVVHLKRFVEENKSNAPMK